MRMGSPLQEISASSSLCTETLVFVIIDTVLSLAVLPVLAINDVGKS